MVPEHKEDPRIQQILATILENQEALTRMRAELLRAFLMDAGSATSDIGKSEKRRVLRRSVRIPEFLTKPTSLGQCAENCAACLLGIPKPPTGDLVTDLVRGSGLPYKLLLTIFRWAHPYSDRSYKFPEWGTTSLKTSDLVREVTNPFSLFDAAGNEKGEPLRNIRNAVKALVAVSLIDEVRRRGQAHTLIPHSGTESARIPDALWRNDWLRALSGAELFLLVHMLAAAEGEEGYRIRSFRVSTLSNTLRLDERRLSDTIHRLVMVGVIVEARTRRGRFLILVQPDLLSKAPLKALVKSSTSRIRNRRSLRRPAAKIDA